MRDVMEQKVAKDNNYNALMKKVTALVKSYNTLKERNRELEDKVVGYEKDRRSARKNIDNIISKIEELEVGH